MAAAASALSSWAASAAFDAALRLRAPLPLLRATQRPAQRACCCRAQ